MDSTQLPEQPGEERWRFKEELQAPLWTTHAWKRSPPAAGQVDLSAGVRLVVGFADPRRRLETAYQDLERFLAAGGVCLSGPAETVPLSGRAGEVSLSGPAGRGSRGGRAGGADVSDRADGVRLSRPAGGADLGHPEQAADLSRRAGPTTERAGVYTLETLCAPDLTPEAYRLEVGPSSCRILAADTEGVRRGIFHLEDLMLRAQAPVLPVGHIERRPFIRRRISRCFFGPIKRPPRMRDELMDDEDYYPPEYLDRLAHEGVNGPWLTVEFRDLCATSITPDGGPDRARRLAKLRRTVDACLRYGIRTYLFCIEPRAWSAEWPVPDAHPELAGSPLGGGHCFCPFSEAARTYLYESTHAIFSAVPELGGLINISHGERATTCLSALSAVGEGRIDCPRCAGREPWEILHASLSAMEQGLHDAAPEAELISWLYMPQARGPFHEGLADWVYDLPAHTPEGVILQFNLETGVRRTEFGRELVGGDYWLSTPGPSPRFERVARTARQAGTSVSAKIQTGCSHELATVPFLPVPSLLYRKFAGMHRLGVSHTMLCWYFGNYPGLMNKGAGLLSFEPFPRDEDDFLRRLAAVTWGEEHVAQVVQAWKFFAQGYERYPLTNLFQYYGPMHDGPVWPLLLEPEDAPLAPTWLLASPATRRPWPPSGDRIGECFMEALTLPQVVELARIMSSSWDRGVEILDALEPACAHRPERLRDIGLARALGIHFRSGYNILRFYLLREQMFRGTGMERLDLLNSLIQIITEELALDQRLLALCAEDSRLGFHSEAEGYKYFPEKIRWRMDQLQKVLDREVPHLERTIRQGEVLFPEYTGRRPTGAVARCTDGGGRLEVQVWNGARVGFPEFPAGAAWQDCVTSSGQCRVKWAAARDAETLYVLVQGTSPGSDVNAFREAGQPADGSDTRTSSGPPARQARGGSSAKAVSWSGGISSGADSRAPSAEGSVPGPIPPGKENPHGGQTDETPSHTGPVKSITFMVEPRRLWPCKHFLFRPGDPWRIEQPDQVAPQSVDGRVAAQHGIWRAVLRIPLARMGLSARDLHPVRVNIQIDQTGEEPCTWRPLHPVTPRLRLGADNPADLGWLIFEEGAG